MSQTFPYIIYIYTINFLINLNDISVCCLYLLKQISHKNELNEGLCNNFLIIINISREREAKSVVFQKFNISSR